LETVVDLLLETQALWQEGWFAPEREVTLRRHIGDYTLFMLGVFRERVERMASCGYYVTQGTRAYRYVSEHDRASARPVRPAGGPLFGRLADSFEGYARALDYTRRVTSAPAPRCRSSYDGFRGLPRRPRGGAGRAEASRRRRPSDARRGPRVRAGDSAARLRRRARRRGAARAHHARRRRGGARRAARGP